MIDPDAELVRNAGAGDARAAEALVRRHLPRMLALSRRMLNDASEAEKQAMVDVFGRYMTTMYAARFKGYGGETFELGESKARDGGRVLVTTQLTRKDNEPIQLSYLMKGQGDTWHITDVYYNGSISQMAQLRSEFSGPLRDGGVTKLKSILEDKIKQLQGGA